MGGQAAGERRSQLRCVEEKAVQVGACLSVRSTVVPVSSALACAELLAATAPRFSEQSGRGRRESMRADAFGRRRQQWRKTIDDCIARDTERERA